jgi:1,4-alpha-glucan branching enzyme
MTVALDDERLHERSRANTMAASQNFVTADTPMGATLVDGGATFRVWAPRAAHVYVARGDTSAYQAAPQDELVRDPSTGHWTGFFPGVVDGSTYRYYVVGTDGSAALKRDPRAVELEAGVALADCDCVVRDPRAYPWHDAGFTTPAFNDLVVYQFHVGVFFARDAGGRDIRPNRVAKLLDALGRIAYLADLGVNAVQPLPVVEFHGPWSQGYNGTDLYSPETDYCVTDADLDPYLPRVNALLTQRERTPIQRQDLVGHVNQLKAFVDVCHVFGIAVVFDVVYNHVGGDLDAASLDHLDMPPHPDAGNSLYLLDRDWAGGKIFAFDRPDVRAFLIDNATMFLDEYHADGLRFDEVTVIDRNGGWSLCQDLTATLHYRTPSAVLIAEYWGDIRSLAVTPAPAGMGFDLGYDDRLRLGVRAVLSQVAGGADAPVDLGPVAAGLQRPGGFPAAWQAYTCLENHDLVLDADGNGHRQLRIARLCGGNDARSWYARSRARVATGLLLAAAGTPMLFMGQEFLEDKLWSDDVQLTDREIWWGGLDGADPAMADFHRFVRDLRADPVSVYPLAQHGRVLAFQRWVPDVGRDVVVVASVAESTFTGDYELGFPRTGYWREVLNSDYYDTFPNPTVQGNAGGIIADGPPRHGMPTSARITVPANSLIVFATDDGDPSTL